ncbi:MAG: nucleoside 2-deoxyribosyltransferase [Gammaproteobacteria bacterium]
MQINPFRHALFSIFLAIALFYVPFAQADTTKPSHKKCQLYFASALFSLREKVFNDIIVSNLEKNSNYSVFLPQRNGFEFSKLNELLLRYFDPHEALRAEQLIIYYLDMGFFLEKSDVILAILDEDIDPGVAVEITYANLMGKPIIGIRTDVRSPYGATPKEGIHFFPLLQLSDLIYFYGQDNSSREIQNSLQQLGKILNQTLAALEQQGYCGKGPSAQAMMNPMAQNIKRGAQLLFDDMSLDEIKSPQGMEKIVKNYQKHRKELNQFYPKEI